MTSIRSFPLREKVYVRIYPQCHVLFCAVNGTDKLCHGQEKRDGVTEHTSRPHVKHIRPSLVGHEDFQSLGLVLPEQCSKVASAILSTQALTTGF